MGYALFTARKLMLQNRLNQMNYRAMVLSQQQQNLAVQSANIQQISGLRTSLTSIYTSQQMSDAYESLGENASESQIDTKVNQMQAMMEKYQAKQDALTSSDSARLASIQVIDNQIDLEMKKIETEIKTTTAEMESVEKAEDSAIKAAAPKYSGGAG